MNDQYLDVEDLITQLQNDQEPALKRIFHLYAPAFFLLIFKIIGDKKFAEDIVSEVFITIWRRRHQISSFNELESMLYALAKEKSFEYFCPDIKDDKIKMGLFSKKYIDCNERFKKIVFTDLEKIIFSEIGSLSLLQKDILKLNLRNGLSIEAIRDKLSISREMVLNNYNLALSVLQKALYRKNYFLSLALLRIICIGVNDTGLY